MKKVSNKNEDYKSHLLLGAKLFCLLLCLKALSPCCCLALAVERAPRRHGAVVLCRVLGGRKHCSSAGTVCATGLGASMEKCSIVGAAVS